MVAFIRLFSAIFVSITVPMFSATMLYERNIHLELTQFLAVAAGFPEAMGNVIARADQNTDDDPETDPLPFWHIQARQDYHFVSPERLADLRMEAQRSCDVTSMGHYLHALEDSYAHLGYPAWRGHWPDARPDQAWRDPKKAMDMAKEKFVQLTQLRNICVLSDSSPKTWREIESQVNAMVSAR